MHFLGFSHTILVYGMTGSGKTYTMFGDNFEIGTITDGGYKNFDNSYKDIYEEDLDVQK